MPSQTEVALDSLQYLHNATTNYRQSLQYQSKSFPVEVIVFWIQHIDLVLAKIQALKERLLKQRYASQKDIMDINEAAKLCRYLVTSSVRELKLRSDLTEW